jgi:hypothetical protein
LRLVSGAGGTTGGTTAYSTVFANQAPTISNTLSVSAVSVGATTLTIDQIPSHDHSYTGIVSGGGAFVEGGTGFGSSTTGATGGGNSHTHSASGGALSGGITSSAITLNVRYANIIICSKN